MIGESSAVSTLNPPTAKASVLITISTPEADAPICRLGNSEDVVKGLTVQQLLERVISPNSLFSIGVPMSQLQAESPTALAIGELLSAGCCEVLSPGKGASPRRSISLQESARAVAREQVGSSGNRFLNINLEVRSAPDAAPPTGEDRRRPYALGTLEVEEKRPVLTGGIVDASSRPAPAESSEPLTSDSEQEPSEEPTGTALGAAPPADLAAAPAALPPVSAPEAPPEERAPAAPEPEAPLVGETRWPSPAAEISADEDRSEPAGTAESVEAAEPAPSDEVETGEAALEPTSEPAAPTPAARPAGEIFTIVAEKPAEEPKAPGRDRKEYARKSDWLRAQFLPEVEALDFSGLFVGNLGLGIREEKARRNVVMADPSRITEVLLRANGYRRNGDHAKALICYQELVDMDPSNADFRFLLGKTFNALGQREEAVEALSRAKELGHDGAERDLEELKRSGHQPKAGLGFLRFWKQ